MKRLILSSIAVAMAISTFAQQYPFQNPDLSFDERAADLLSRLTLEEKAQLMYDQSPAIPRLGIKSFNWWSEALHGMANNNDVTVFPEPIGMAASFDDELLFKVFDATSDEFRAKYNEANAKGEENQKYRSLSVWTPNINIFRDPRWGRGMETYGEDPYLTARMGTAVVKGLQNNNGSKYLKLLACAKHFAVHSGPEWNRHTLNVNNVSKRDLYETYLPAFEALVKDADVREVMCAYQRLDDEPCCGNTRLLQRILRDDWGFKYLVVSDCGAIADFHTNHKVSSTPVHTAAKGILAGTDVECYWENYYYQHAPEAVAQGLMRTEDIDRSVTRLIMGRLALGELDDPSVVEHSKIGMDVVNSKEHQELALQMARESMVLLQNKGNILPLKKSIKKIAVIGANADNDAVLWGNYNGKPARTITVLDGIKSMVSTDALLYDVGCDLVENKVTNSYISKCKIDGKKGIKATYYNNPTFEGKPVTTDQITIPLKKSTNGMHPFAPNVNLEKFSAIYETEFTADEDAELSIKIGAIGVFALFVNGDSVGGQRNWHLNPMRIPFNVEKGKTYNIKIKFYQVKDWAANIEFDFGTETDVVYTDLINKLKGYDVVVYVGGLSSGLEGEEMPVSYPGFKGGDRTNIDLPDVQRNCLKALKQAGKKVVFVNMSGSAIALTPETETCDAILQAWYGGESGGQAIAEVLFGDFNPCGKLPITFYKSSEQLPDFEDYSMKGRTYRYFNDPLFAFGYGLSYTKYTIGNATVSATQIDKNQAFKLVVPVKNIGKMTGTEVVQVYVRKIGDESGLQKSLRGFKRIEVTAGKSADAEIELPYTAFKFFDDATGEMAIRAGKYEVLYGNSSDNLKSVVVEVKE